MIYHATDIIIIFSILSGNVMAFNVTILKDSLEITLYFDFFDEIYGHFSRVWNSRRFTKTSVNVEIPDKSRPDERRH